METAILMNEELWSKRLWCKLKTMIFLQWMSLPERAKVRLSAECFILLKPVDITQLY